MKYTLETEKYSWETSMNTVSSAQSIIYPSQQVVTNNLCEILAGFIFTTNVTKLLYSLLSLRKFC